MSTDPRMDDNTTTTTTHESKYLTQKSSIFIDPLDHPNPRHGNQLDDEEEEEWTITPEMIQRLNQSEWLRNELRDGGLRRIIYDIDRAKDNHNDTKQQRKKQRRLSFRQRNETLVVSAREQAMIDAKSSNIHFSHFMDRLLFTAGVFIPHENNTKSDMCIQGNYDYDDETEAWENCKQQLVLVPLPSKKPIFVEDDCDDDKDDNSSSQDDENDKEQEEVETTDDDTDDVNEEEGDYEE